uniref:Uncharacterized protein n=1 Tax=Graphocephala atropunctata TaxID=36148 RepID=A0A1B6MKB2_9HEMI
MLQPEDEWKEVQLRFVKEGLDYDALKPEDRLLHVWRWLVDAESNLKNSRRMLDKLHEQQNEEIEEMESYMGHIRDMAVKRADSLQYETVELRAQVDTVTKLLANTKLQPGSLDHQIMQLLTEKSKLEEELDILKKLKVSTNSNGVNGEGEMLNEIIKVSSEKEVLRRQLTEMTDRVEVLEKATRQIELDNERLAYKASKRYCGPTCGPTSLHGQACTKGINRRRLWSRASQRLVRCRPATTLTCTTRRCLTVLVPTPHPRVFWSVNWPALALLGNCPAC